MLETIVAQRFRRIECEFGELTAADRERLACCSRPPRDFIPVLRNRLDVAVIAEVQKCSPGAGEIAPDCEASKQALHYQDGGAAAISVLTEPDFFGGSFTDLSDVADAVDVPVLCADYVVDPVQLFVARGHGADAVLLMVSVLGPAVAQYLDLAESLGLTPLVEVAEPAELHVALHAGAALISVNVPDTGSPEADVAAQREIIASAKEAGATVVAAAGVARRRDVEAAALAGADAVLVGETLMRSPFPEDVLAELTGVRKGVSS